VGAPSPPAGHQKNRFLDAKKGKIPSRARLPGAKYINEKQNIGD
jgi:hypothetical protein